MAMSAFTGGFISTYHQTIRCMSQPYVAPEGALIRLQGCQTDSNGRPGLPCELCQSRSPTDGMALLFVSLNVCFRLPHPTPFPPPAHPTPPLSRRQPTPPLSCCQPTPTDVICDITAIEKYLKYLGHSSMLLSS